MFASSPLHGDPVNSRKTDKFVGVSLSLSYLATHTNSLDSLSLSYLQTHKFLGLCLVQDESTSTRSWCNSAARLDGSFVTVKTTASSRLSGHRARVILLQSIIIALYFGGLFLLLAQHAHAVFARISVHESQNPQFLCTSITKIDGSCSSPNGWRCTTARQAVCALVHDTSTRSLCVFMCRRSETSTCGLCKAADVQRSGPGPGRRAHEAAQRQTQFLDHVLCLGSTITSRRYLPQCLRRARAACA